MASDITVGDPLQWGRGIDIKNTLSGIHLHLPIPCTTSDFNTFMLLIKEISRKLKSREIICEDEIYAIKRLSAIKNYTRNAMEAGLDFISNLDTEKNNCHLQAMRIQLAIDATEQNQFKHNQAKFDQYLDKKQRTRGINEQLTPDQALSTGNSETIFIKAGRYSIIPTKITRFGTHMEVPYIFLAYEDKIIDYRFFLDKVKKTRFDAEKVIIKISKQELLDIFKKCPKSQSTINSALQEEKKFKQSYKDLGFNLNHIKTLDNYFDAIANLYGVISLKDAFKIIRKQTTLKYPDKLLLKFAEQKNHEAHHYTIVTIDNPNDTPTLENDIVNLDLLTDSDLHNYNYTKQCQQGKPLYIPDKTTLLKYKDYAYFEPNEALTQLENYLKRNAYFYGGNRLSKIILKSMIPRIRCEDGINELLTTLLHHIILISPSIPQEEFLQQTVQLLSDVINTTRIWPNRGFTPRELASPLRSPKQR